MESVRTIIMFCTITGIIATPLSDLQGYQTNAIRFHTENEGNLVVKSEQQLKSVILLRHLSTMYTRDFFSDLIMATLGMSVRDLLGKVQTVLKNLERVIKQGMTEMEAVEGIASPEIIEELKSIRNNAMNEVIEMTGLHTKELGTVLPVLQSDYSPHDSTSASDIIYALLGKTLEELVTAIAKALDTSLQILNGTIADVLRLTASASQPEVASALRRIADEQLNRGRTIITPMLDQLRQLVDIPDRVLAKTKREASNHGGLLDTIISNLLGVSTESCGKETNIVLTQLIPLIESTREEICKALQTDHQVENNKVLTQVMNIYDSAVDDVIRDVKPILITLLQFESNARRQKTFVYDMAGSLLGVGVETFRDYVQNASSRVERVSKLSHAKIITLSAKAGFSSFLKVWRILHLNMRSAKTISSLLVEILRKIVEAGNENIYFEKELHTDKESWAEEDGRSYNRDAIINTTSNILGFEVAEATKKLQTSLQDLDELMESGLMELESILSETDTNLRMDILGIMNEALTDIHILLQPMLDVLLPFLPDEVRSNKKVALDIYTASNGVDVDSFLRYCSFVARKIPEITNIAALRAKVRAARAGPRVHGRIAYLLKTTDSHTKAIIKPFIEMISPIISPH